LHITDSRNSWWMNTWNLLGSLEGVVIAQSFDEASAGLRATLATGPSVRTIRVLFNPTSAEITPWLESVKVVIPEIRGLMVQRFFARLFCKAGYEVVVGSKLDIFARNRLRSLFLEVKSSLSGGSFGSRAEIAQLDGYLIASERRGAERWLGIMGINKPVRLRAAFKTEMRRRNIGLIDIRWASSAETLLPYFESVP
jgi:hypothetical protein